MKVLELISKFSKVTGYNTIVQKSAMFIHTSYKKLGKGNQNAIPLSQRPKCGITKYLGII